MESARTVLKGVLAELWCDLGQEILKKVSDSGGTCEASLLFK